MGYRLSLSPHKQKGLTKQLCSVTLHTNSTPGEYPGCATVAETVHEIGSMRSKGVNVKLIPSVHYISFKEER